MHADRGPKKMRRGPTGDLADFGTAAKSIYARDLFMTVDINDNESRESLS